MFCVAKSPHFKSLLLLCIIHFGAILLSIVCFLTAFKMYLILRFPNVRLLTSLFFVVMLMAYSSTQACLPFFSAIIFRNWSIFPLVRKTRLTSSLLLIQISFSRLSVSHLWASPTTLAFFFSLPEILHPFLFIEKWWRAIFVRKTTVYFFPFFFLSTGIPFFLVILLIMPFLLLTMSSLLYLISAFL